MTRLITFLLAILLLSSVLFVEGSASPKTPRKFDEFGDLNCEDEMARLDNFAIQLQNSSSDTGYIIFYGGRRFRGRSAEARRRRGARSSPETLSSRKTRASE